jgi:hypothetical protein
MQGKFFLNERNAYGSQFLPLPHHFALVISKATSDKDCPDYRLQSAKRMWMDPILPKFYQGTAGAMKKAQLLVSPIHRM